GGGGAPPRVSAAESAQPLVLRLVVIAARGERRQVARHDIELVRVEGAGGRGRPDVPARQACAGDPARQEEDGAKQIEVERGGACRRGRGRGNRLRDGPREAARRWQRDGFGAWVAPIEGRLVRPGGSGPVCGDPRR